MCGADIILSKSVGRLLAPDRGMHFNALTVFGRTHKKIAILTHSLSGPNAAVFLLRLNCGRNAKSNRNFMREQHLGAMLRFLPHWLDLILILAQRNSCTPMQ